MYAATIAVEDANAMREASVNEGMIDDIGR